ncbi:MAG TPA: hypothetical protein DCS01_03120 [Idiomarina abyssalis]|uniref:hypothetical protein n=1 Tax=Gammaproteobacteria TaxID=1236 RepID=UPI000C3B4B99|nr:MULTISPECIES: hypothetical protein [Gammaproteobacteria]MBH94508.1 hypothetical protein [Idiomarina sp.]HAS14275.1 hypothetical protein [Idiomarina abyssalis]|tara:strand:- start:2795 stop:3346 length:552 start_codon:yes stop_codon:yes gene_type:complete
MIKEIRKGLVVLSLSIGLSACVATAPSSVSESEQSVSIERDEFNGQTWIRTPLFLSRQGFTDTFPVSIAYRALYKDQERVFIQLYVTKKSTEWGFYHTANGQDGTELPFVDVDKQVDANTQLGSVYVDEDFALKLSRDYLSKMSQEDWKIKVYGKRDEGVFMVPKTFTQGFLNKLECYEAGNC